MELFDGLGGLITSNDDGGGNLNSEIIYTPPTSGAYYIDAGAFNNKYTGTYRVSVSGAHKAAADFNGDNFSDILWQNVNGQAAIWEMNGTNVIASPGLNP